MGVLKNYSVIMLIMESRRRQAKRKPHVMLNLVMLNTNNKKD